MKMENIMRKCLIHFVFAKLSYESSFLKRAAVTWLQRHNWRFVPLANFSGQIINAWVRLLEPHCGGGNSGSFERPA